MIGGVGMYGAWFIIPIFIIGLHMISKKEVQ